MTIPRVSAAAALIAAAALVSVPAPASAATSVSAHFRGGSGSYLTTPDGTDNLRQVDGTVTFSQAAPGAPITETGSLTGLQPSTYYVTVPYKDGACIPAAGVTAFPSTAFGTDASGSATFSATVNAGAINPLGVLDLPEVHSVSVRQVVVQGTYVPGVLKLPTVPNVAAVEACDRFPG